MSKTCDYHCNVMKGIYKLQSKIALHELFDIEAVAKSEKCGYQLMHMQIASVSS